jgi:FMN phosphatase YigB (HAD superfamily)
MSIAEVLGVLPEECLMVGNDVLDDMSAAGVGMKVFLLTDHHINEKDADISVYPRGSFDELLRYISEL